MRKHPENVIRRGEMYWARSVCSGLLRAGRSVGRIPILARCSATVQTGRGANPASCAMSTGSPSREVVGQGVTLTKHPDLARMLKKTLSIFPQKMMYDFTGILEDVCGFQNNSPTSDVTKMPVYSQNFSMRTDSHKIQSYKYTY